MSHILIVSPFNKHCASVFLSSSLLLSRICSRVIDCPQIGARTKETDGLGGLGVGREWSGREGGRRSKRPVITRLLSLPPSPTVVHALNN